MKNKKIKILIIFVLVGIVFSVASVSSDSIGDNSSTIITVSGGVDCVGGGTYWNNSLDLTNIITTPTMGAGGNCFNALGTNGNTCCPSGYQCVYSNTGVNGAVYNCTYTGVNYCSDLKDQTNCTYATQQISLDTAALTPSLKCGYDPLSWVDPVLGNCHNVTSCSCKWDGTKCVGFSLAAPNCSGGNVDPSRIKTCSLSMVVDDQCDSGGVITVYISASGTAKGDSRYPYCQDSTKQMSCEDVAKLDFFGNLQFAITIIALIAIYLVYFLFFKSKNNLRKKKISKKK